MKTTLLSILLLTFYCSFAQPKEYIVKHNGDTIAGQITVQPQRILITKPGTKDTVSFPSEEVWQAVKDKKSKTVLKLILYGYTDNINIVTSGSAYTNPVYDTTVLLKPVITGERLNLYTAKDKRKVDYFFIQGIKDSVPVQLLYSVGGGMQNKDALPTKYQFTSYVSKSNVFKDQLFEITGDCEAISSVDYELLVYMEYSLKKFIKSYNKNCR